jgi:dsRNA-specific ribonuclease
MEAIGPDHANPLKCWSASTVKTLGVGCGKSKKEAEQDAAKAALEALKGNQ